MKNWKCFLGFHDEGKIVQHVRYCYRFLFGTPPADRYECKRCGANLGWFKSNDYSETTYEHRNKPQIIIK